jgi:hypothetical protein
MNFQAALAATDSNHRDQAIAAEIAAHDWLDFAARHMEHGGWPDNAAAQVLQTTIDNETIYVMLAVELTELCPQGCNAYPRRFHHSVPVKLLIDRCTGTWQIAAA